MWKKFGLTGMLFATLAVAPLTISAQDWNNQRNADSAHRSRTQGSVVTQHNSYNSAHGGYAQSDRDDRGRNGRSFAIQDRARDTRNYGRSRTYAAQRDCNR